MLYWLNHIRYHAISTCLSLKGEIFLFFVSLLLSDLLTEAVVMHGWLPLLGLGGLMLSVVPTLPSSNKYSSFSSQSCLDSLMCRLFHFFYDPRHMFPIYGHTLMFLSMPSAPFSVDGNGSWGLCLGSQHEHYMEFRN